MATISVVKEVATQNFEAVTYTSTRSPRFKFAIWLLHWHVTQHMSKLLLQEKVGFERDTRRGKVGRLRWTRTTIMATILLQTNMMVVSLVMFTMVMLLQENWNRQVEWVGAYLRSLDNACIPLSRDLQVIVTLAFLGKPWLHRRMSAI